MVAAFIFLLEENRNLRLKPDSKAQVCTSSWRLAALWWPSSKFTGGSGSCLTGDGEHVLGECCSQLGAEVSALAVVCHTCEVGWALEDTSGGGGITLCIGKSAPLSSAPDIPHTFNHLLQPQFLDQVSNAAPSIPQTISWSNGSEMIQEAL